MIYLLPCACLHTYIHTYDEFSFTQMHIYMETSELFVHDTQSHSKNSTECSSHLPAAVRSNQSVYLMVNLTLGQTKGPCSASSYQTLQTVNSIARPLTRGNWLKPQGKTAKSTALFIPLWVLEPSALRWLLAAASGSDPQILFDLAAVMGWTRGGVIWA